MHREALPTQDRREMIPYLIWGEEHRAEIGSVEVLDQLVDDLTAKARAEMPMSIELYHSDRIMLLVIIGREESYMQFHSDAYIPYLWTCRGPWDDDEHIEFLYRGHFSGISKQYTVPITEAREALRQFLRTGERPSNVVWEPA